MENIVYLLGAGFSAPLGIPTVANFLAKSKEMREQNPGHYQHFDDIFNIIDNIATTKNYFDADLHNVEEILSILEMEFRLQPSAANDELSRFTQYVKEVVTHFTPELPDVAFFPGNWMNTLFSDNLLTQYAIFVASLLNLQLMETRREVRRDGRRVFRCQHYANATTSYSVVTLNYDLVLEKFVGYWRDFIYEQNEREVVHLKAQKQADPVRSFDIAKLHGSVDSDVIVLPTWNKSITPEIFQAWHRAYEVLSRAHRIRIIGYSLPPNDAYMKYLLKSAVRRARYLKTIDVLCLDNSKGEIEERYRSFVTFKSFRFQRNNVKDYLSVIYNQSVGEGKMEDIEPIWTGVTLDKLEGVHERFFSPTT